MKNLIKMKVSPKTIYTDIVGLQDPLWLGVTIHYYNESGDPLYMKIFISHPNWASGSYELGLLPTASSAFYNWDNCSSRSKPITETTEAVTFTLKGYSDAAYTIEMASFSRDVTVVMLKSDDGSWTLDEHDNFDTPPGVQGWACKTLPGDQSMFLACDIATDFKLSSPNSYKIISQIINVSSPWYKYCFLKYWEFKEGSNLLMHLGAPESEHSGWEIRGDKIPKQKWIRMVVPLPKDKITEIQIIQDSMATYGIQANHRRGLFCAYKTFTTPNKDTIYAIVNIRGDASATGSPCLYKHYMWLDDFKIISRD